MKVKNSIADRFISTSVIFRQFLLLIILVSFSFAKDIKVSAYVDRTKVTTEDIITFTVEVEGTTDFPNVPTPGGADFVVISGPSQSSSIQIINGAMTASKTVKWRLAPTRTGKLEIKPVIFKYRRKTYGTNPIVITVTDKGKTIAPGQRSRPTPGSEQKSFKSKTDSELYLKAVPSKTTVYRGEEIDVSFDLYYKNVKTFSRKKLPDAQSFWMEEFPTTSNPAVATEVINGIVYKKASIQRLAFFPTKTGELTIDPMIIDCEVMVPRQRRRSLFDDFFDDSFFRDSFFGSTRVITVASRQIKVNVKPLPEEGKPSNFSGAVGKYSIQSSIDTLVTTQDQALTLKYKISGMGNINAVKLPELDFPKSVEVFEPKIERKINNKKNKIQGSVIYEYVLIPRRAGDITIPALSFSYFDPSQEKYRRAVSKAFNIKVHHQEKLFASQSLGQRKEEISLLGEDIRFISRENPKWYKANLSIFSEAWFWITNTFTLIIVFGAVGFRWWTEKMETNVAFARKRRAWTNAQKGLKEAEKVLNVGAKEVFFTHLDHAIIIYISDRLALAVSGVGPREIEAKLKEENVDSKIIKNIDSVLKRIGLERFSPGVISESECKSLLEESKNIISGLSKVI